MNEMEEHVARALKIKLLRKIYEELHKRARPTDIETWQAMIDAAVAEKETVAK